MEYRPPYNAVRVYTAYALREIRGNDEILRGRAQHIDTVVGLQSRMEKIQQKIEKELKSKSPDIKRLDRLNAILKNIQGTLAKCKER